MVKKSLSIMAMCFIALLIPGMAAYCAPEQGQ